MSLQPTINEILEACDDGRLDTTDTLETILAYLGENKVDVMNQYLGLLTDDGEEGEFDEDYYYRYISSHSNWKPFHVLTENGYLYFLGEIKLEAPKGDRILKAVYVDRTIINLEALFYLSNDNEVSIWKLLGLGIEVEYEGCSSEYNLDYEGLFYALGFGDD